MGGRSEIAPLQSWAHPPSFPHPSHPSLGQPEGASGTQKTRDPRVAAAARGAASAGRQSSKAVVLQAWNSCALSPAESLRAGGSRDPTETPWSPPPLCERERHESREKEKLLRIRGRGLPEGDGPGHRSQ